MYCTAALIQNSVEQIIDIDDGGDPYFTNISALIKFQTKVVLSNLTRHECNVSGGDTFFELPGFRLLYAVAVEFSTIPSETDPSFLQNLLYFNIFYTNLPSRKFPLLDHFPKENLWGCNHSEI